ncbi:hypothetical protein DERP_007531 [Dermatophagoides pteronyssinus]|uniref:Uncharacterized protein n=1 Tax=Dermatophagoides pteronyssinus TaxID=6956 RepID=A0ABQ8J4L5_DERPT|nr:hypothetical protein DERP_007531 [Dermatophagoides pteronyssinus]
MPSDNVSTIVRRNSILVGCSCSSAMLLFCKQSTIRSMSCTGQSIFLAKVNEFFSEFCGEYARYSFIEPDLIMARRKRPRANGDKIIAEILIEPADCPNTVTFAGSPPKRSIFCWIQRNDNIKSWTP